MTFSLPKTFLEALFYLTTRMTCTTKASKREERKKEGTKKEKKRRKKKEKERGIRGEYKENERGRMT